MERDPTTMMIARNIEVWMTRRDLDPTRLARLAKLGQTGVHDILSGKSKNPGVVTLAKIADALQVPLPVLLEEPDARAMRIDMFNAFEKMPEVQRRLLLQTARSWVQSDHAQSV